MKSPDFISCPDNLIGDKSYIRNCIVGVNRIGYDFIPAILKPNIIPHPAIMAVGIVNITDVFLLPNSMGYPYYVIYNVCIGIFKSSHGMKAF
ncbi:MAG: hypothetical protein F4170_06295 [Rhodobacteraceae bacterium]|nr:hypothetical protein [Paracoccaceae bacterium]